MYSNCLNAYNIIINETVVYLKSTNSYENVNIKRITITIICYI